MKNELIGSSTLRSYIEAGWRTSELTWRYGLARRQRRLTETTRHDATRTARHGRTSTLPTAFNWRSIKATHRVPGSGSFAGGPFLCAQCTRAPWESRSALAIRSASFIASGTLAPRAFWQQSQQFRRQVPLEHCHKDMFTDHYRRERSVHVSLDRDL